MSWVRSENAEAIMAAEVLEGLQRRYVNALCAFSEAEAVEKDWMRAGGAQGGGNRWTFVEGGWLATASVNFSQVHYDADSGARLSVATALSAIVHPRHPLLPSAHLHVSLTQLQTGACYWRLMGDLNPAVENEQHRMQFDRMLARVAPDQVAEAIKNGDRYFNIPMLERQRGVSHFYLEQFWRGDAEVDVAFAERFGDDNNVYGIFDGRSEFAGCADRVGAGGAAGVSYAVSVSGVAVRQRNDSGVVGA